MLCGRHAHDPADDRTASAEAPHRGLRSARPRGAVEAYAKTELIEGVIEVVNAEFRRHNHVRDELTFRLRLALQTLGSAFGAFDEASLALPSENLPQPDIVVATGGLEERYYELRDVTFVVEVADSTLDRDLGGRAAMYATQGVPE